MRTDPTHSSGICKVLTRSCVGRQAGCAADEALRSIPGKDPDSATAWPCSLKGRGCDGYEYKAQLCWQKRSRYLSERRFRDETRLEISSLCYQSDGTSQRAKLVRQSNLLFSTFTRRASSRTTSTTKVLDTAVPASLGISRINRFITLFPGSFMLESSAIAFPASTNTDKRELLR